MATDVLDEHRFSSQCSLYEPPTRSRISKESKRRPTTASTAALYETASTASNTRHRRVKYPTQTSLSSNHSTTNSIHNRHSSSNDFLSLFRSFAMKPFKTSSMTNAITEGQTNNIIGGNQTNSKPPVSLLKYRPLSDSVTDHISHSQSTRNVTSHTKNKMPCGPCTIITYDPCDLIQCQTEDFLKRMGWPVTSTTDEARVKWKTAMKFLIPVKFDVIRAISLYRVHENIRKNENLDHIWISNPNLVREIQSNKFFLLPQLPNQPLTVYFTAAHFTNTLSTSSLSQQDRELVALQALICQLDVATESMHVQQSGLNFIYDLQNCSASQFDMNLSKKILKFLQGGYPAMVKNIFIISAPKWFKIAYKVTMYTPDQMREVFTTQYGYSLDDIPISLGGSFDPTLNGDNRYQMCLSSVTNSQSICYPYYSLDYQPITTKSTSNILFFNSDHHHHQNQGVASAATSSSPPPTTTTKAVSPQTSLVAIVALRRHHESSLTSHVRVRKRESSSSSDSEKRRRGSNGSLIEEEEPRSIINSLTYIPQEIHSE